MLERRDTMMADAQQGDGGRPVGVRGLVADLSFETRALIRQQIELAKIELGEKLRALGLGAALLALGAVLMLYAFAVLTAAAVAALALVFETWLAALIVGAVYLLLVGMMGGVGIWKLRTFAGPTPDETIETVKEDVTWLRQKTRSKRK